MSPEFNIVRDILADSLQKLDPLTDIHSRRTTWDWAALS